MFLLLLLCLQKEVIADFLTLNTITIYTYLNRWNEIGTLALEDYRGKTPSHCKMTAEMEYDLLQVVQHKISNDFDFLGNVWTANLLSDYLYCNYCVKLSAQCIRDIVHKNNFSFKRAQKKPSKGIKSEQEMFKKMIETTLSVENDSESVLYVMDETALRTESDNRRTWSLVGVSPILESNVSHQGVNIIGATQITKNFDMVADIYDTHIRLKI